MKTSFRKALSLIAVICLTVAIMAPVALADNEIGFPEKSTITLVVPGKAGGGSDLAIRYYAQALTDLYGLKTTVTNYDSNTPPCRTTATPHLLFPPAHLMTILQALWNMQKLIPVSST